MFWLPWCDAAASIKILYAYDETHIVSIFSIIADTHRATKVHTGLRGRQREADVAQCGI